MRLIKKQSVFTVDLEYTEITSIIHALKDVNCIGCIYFYSNKCQENNLCMNLINQFEDVLLNQRIPVNSITKKED